MGKTTRYKDIILASSPEEIFGDVKDLSSLDEKYDDISREVSGKVKDLLDQFYGSAKIGMTLGVYGAKKSNTSKKGANIIVNGQEYLIKGDVVEGDFSEVYHGNKLSNDLEEICIKVASNLENNSLLKTEAYVLGKLDHKSLPKIIDSFTLEDGRRANIMESIVDSYDLYTLREKFPAGIDPYHASWILERLLSVLGYVHSKKIIHGGIEPGNVMITSKDHNGFMIDFTLAVPEAHRPGAKYKGSNDYSAPEIESGEKPNPAVDMYSLGLTMTYLLGSDDGTIPKKIDSRLAGFISGFLEKDPSKRKNDAWKEYHDLKKLRWEVFGPPQFRNLEIKEV